jgi:peptide/nickel transport system permease protein
MSTEPDSRDDSPAMAAAVAANRRRGGLMAFARAQPIGALALAVIVLMFGAGALAPKVAPYNPLDIDFDALLEPPSAQHWLGTDGFGRDILSRIVWGARTALNIGFASSFIGCAVGTLIGVASAYHGGRVDLVIQRFVDLLLAFPIIVLALVVVAMLGRHTLLGIDLNLILAIAIPVVPQVTRVMRASALIIRTEPYIDAARLAGLTSSRIILCHMLPNLTAPFFILLTAFVAQAILLEASLSFLGLGVAEPTPAWGLMLAGNAGDLYREAPWIVIFPGAAISLAVFAFNFLGDSLRDWLDPRCRDVTRTSESVH